MAENPAELKGQQAHPQSETPPPRKKSYATPRLTVHGTLTEITKQNLPGTPNDGLVGRCS
jgi:hypothetical protein